MYSDTRSIELYQKFSIFIFVGIIYFRFVILTVLNDSNIIFDIVLYFLLIFSIIRPSYNYDVIVILLLAALSILNPAARNIFLVLTTVYLLSLFNIKEIAIINLFYMTIVFISICIMLNYGIIKSQQFPMSLTDMRERWDFGFGNPNTLAIFTYTSLVNLYILLQKNGKMLFSIISIIIIPIVGDYTGSRTFTICSLILLLSYWLCMSKRMQLLFIKCRKLIAVVPFIIIILLYVAIKTSRDNPELNLLLSGRLALYGSLINNSSIKMFIFGNPEVMDELIDNAYIHLIFEGGILGMAIFLYLYCSYALNLNKRNIKYLPITFSILLYGLTESVFTAILNYGIIVFWSILYKEYLISKKKPKKTNILSENCLVKN